VDRGSKKQCRNIGISRRSIILLVQGGYRIVGGLSASQTVAVVGIHKAFRATLADPTSVLVKRIGKRDDLPSYNKQGGYHVRALFRQTGHNRSDSSIRDARPPIKDRKLFFQARAPYAPLTSSAISQRVSRYLRKANIPVARLGSHTLRHTACNGWSTPTLI
jgi:integrase